MRLEVEAPNGARYLCATGLMGERKTGTWVSQLWQHFVIIRLIEEQNIGWGVKISHSTGRGV
jgi:hypothetical protein